MRAPAFSYASRPRKYSTVAFSPSSSGTFGAQPPSSSCARAMFGLRRTGTSFGNGAFTTPARHQSHEALDQIRDVAERARLLAVVEHRQRLPRQRLHHEIRNHAPVVFVHARPVRVEDARDAHLDPVLARVADGQRTRNIDFE